MSPDKVQARKMVLVGVLLLAVISVYRDRKVKQDSAGTFRTIWGVAVVGMFLSLLADFVPTVAGPFAILIVLGSLTNGGDKALQSVLGAIVPHPSASTSQTARSGSGSPATPVPATG